MRKKKSYMNKENILSEGFFDKLKSLLGFDKREIKSLKKNKKFMSHVDSLNKNWSDLAKMIERDYGEKVKFDKFTAKDFLK